MPQTNLPVVVKGYLFNEARTHVCLLRKDGKFPAMAGKLCAPGGKVEPNEGYLDAIIREFFEETGVRFERWVKYGAYTNNEPRTVVMFAGFSDIVNEVFSKTDEEVIVTPVHPLPDDLYMIDRWSIPMALDEGILAGTRRLYVNNWSSSHGEDNHRDFGKTGRGQEHVGKPVGGGLVEHHSV